MMPPHGIMDKYLPFGLHSVQPGRADKVETGTAAVNHESPAAAAYPAHQHQDDKHHEQLPGGV